MAPSLQSRADAPVSYSNRVVRQRGPLHFFFFKLPKALAHFTQISSLKEGQVSPPLPCYRDGLRDIGQPESSAK